MFESEHPDHFNVWNGLCVKIKDELGSVLKSSGDEDELLYHTLRGHSWVHFAHRPTPVVYCYPELKLSYLKNLKLFSIRAIRVKELFEPQWFCKKKKKKADQFLLFLKGFS